MHLAVAGRVREVVVAVIQISSIHSKTVVNKRWSLIRGVVNGRDYCIDRQKDSQPDSQPARQPARQTASQTASQTDRQTVTSVKLKKRPTPPPTLNALAT